MLRPTDACVYGNDTARLYSRFHSGKIIDAALFVDCFSEADDDPSPVMQIG